MIYNFKPVFITQVPKYTKGTQKTIYPPPHFFLGRCQKAPTLTLHAGKSAHTNVASAIRCGVYMRSLIRSRLMGSPDPKGE